MELEQFRSQVLTEQGRSALKGLPDPDLLVGEFFWELKQQGQRGDVETFKAILWCFVDGQLKKQQLGNAVMRG